jgi:hypothetical protein
MQDRMPHLHTALPEIALLGLGSAGHSRAVLGRRSVGLLG